MCAKSLQELCIKALAADNTIDHDFDAISGLQQGQITFDILRRKIITYKNLKKHQIDGLISKGLSQFKVYYNWIDYPGNYGQDLIHEIVKTLGAKKCPLRKFCLSQLSACDINTLLPALHKVRKIAICNSQLNSDVFKVLLKHCRDLRHLKLRCDIEEDVIDFILTEFKSLNSFTTSKEGQVDSAICRLKRLDPTFSSSLNEIKVHFMHGTTLEEVISSLQELKSIFVSVPDDSMPDFRCLNTAKSRLHELVITVEHEEIVYDAHISEVIQYHGATLSKLYLELINDVNLAHIIRECPNVKDLHLGDCSYTLDNTPLSLKPLKKLTYLAIVTEDPVYLNNIIGENCWLALLGEATNLYELTLSDLNGTSLQSALKEVYKRHNFPALRHFTISKVNVITLTDLFPMIEYSDNPLRWVTILDCVDIDKGELKSYAKRVNKK